MTIRSAGLLLLVAGTVDAATFSYERRLDDRGLPANGVYDVQLTPFSASAVRQHPYTRELLAAANLV